jgi:hypothetical protein
MRTLVFATSILLAGCNAALPGDSAAPIGDGGDLTLPSGSDQVDLATAGSKVDLATGAPDPCGVKDPQTGFYGCAYLVGSCPTAGLSCLCWERGTMVCQEDLQWELILDVGHCPDTEAMPGQYQGLGCIGASDHCGACTCDRVSETYQCPDGGA